MWLDRLAMRQWCLEYGQPHMQQLFLQSWRLVLRNEDWIQFIRGTNADLVTPLRLHHAASHQ